MLCSAIIASSISTAVSRPYDSHLSQRRDGFKLSPWPSAILRDHSTDPYAYQPSAGHCFPRHGASLTYLLLQVQADPNILPPKTQPTSMLELAVELGSSQLVQTLLEAGASVMPVKGALPPLFLAVLHRHRTNVQVLLDAQANPWQEIAIASVLCHSLQWHGHAARKKSSTLYKLLLRRVQKTRSLTCYSNSVTLQEW